MSAKYRAKKSESEKTWITVYVESELADQLKMHADDTGRSLSNYLRLVLKESVERVNGD